MKRFSYLILAALMIVLALQTIPVQAFSVSAWTPLYEGIDYATGTATSPRLMKAFAFRIDLRNPYVAMAASPGNGGAPYDTALQNTTAFRDQYGLKAACNASFFNANLSPNTDIWGLLVSGGGVVSPPDYAAPFNSYASFTSSNIATISAGNSVPPGSYNAVAGAEIVLTNGQVSSGNTDVQPRTAIGISQNGNYAIAVCIDGRQSGWSDGCNHPELAQWLLDFGAWNGVLMDGGGSTCMSIAGLGNYVNRPCYGYARAVGANFGAYSTNYINPPYLFDSGNDHWFTGNALETLAWTNCCGWPGIIYATQTGADAYIYSGTMNTIGQSSILPEVVSVNLCPLLSSTSAHDMQVFWKTAAEPYFDAAKSSATINYTVANNNWIRINVPVNSPKWWGQTINQLRLDFDNVNHGARYHVSDVVKQGSLWWWFGSSVEGWTPMRSLSTLWQTTCCGWDMGILYCDQTGNDAYMHSPMIPAGGAWPYFYLAGANDRIHVRVYPMNGNTVNHDMAIYWIHDADMSWTEAKSTHVTYTGQNQWVDVYLPVGTNANWAGKHIEQIRLDFDEVNHNNRWQVDYIGVENQSM